MIVSAKSHKYPVDKRSRSRLFSWFSIIVVVYMQTLWLVWFKLEASFPDSSRRGPKGMFVGRESVGGKTAGDDDLLLLQEEKQPPPPKHRLALDVLSVGSQTRPDYQTTQRATWASHPYVRQFVAINEQDDWDPNCATQLKSESSLFDDISHWCSRTAARPNANNVSKLEFNWRRFTFQKKPLQQKGTDPIKWLCAQQRPIAGLIQLLRSYTGSLGNATSTSTARPNNTTISSYDTTTIPDFVAIVDDDTYLNVDMLHENLQSRAITPQTSFVGAGCLVQKTATAFYYVGGSGLVMSRATIQRMLTPIHCTGVDDDATWCHQILHKHQIGEHLYWKNGMSLLDLMETRAKTERFTHFQEHRNWTKGFCFHSDFFLAIFVELYHLSTQQRIEPLRPQSKMIYHELNGKVHQRRTHGDCLYTTDLPCNPKKAITCHYQAPFMMQQLHNESKNNGSSVLANKRLPTTKQLVIKPRSFTKDRNNPELIRLSSPHEIGREALSLQIQQDLMVVVGGYVGGCNGYDNASSLVHFFNITSQQWLSWYHCLQLPVGVAQTHQGIAFDEHWRFFGEWHELPPLPMARYAPGAVLVPNPDDTREAHLHVFGGASEQRDQPARNHWRLVLKDGYRVSDAGVGNLRWEELNPVLDSGTHSLSFHHQGIIYHTAFCDLDNQVVQGRHTMLRCQVLAKTKLLQKLHHTQDAGLMIAYPTQFAGTDTTMSLAAHHWNRLPDMPFPGCHISMALVADDKVVFFSGGVAGTQTKKGSSPQPLKHIQVFDLPTNSWQSTASLDQRTSITPKASIPQDGHVNNLMLWADPVKRQLFALRNNETLIVSDYYLSDFDPGSRNANHFSASFEKDRINFLKETRALAIDALTECLPLNLTFDFETPLKKNGKYNEARLTWNYRKEANQFPDMIAFPRSAGDVSTLVKCARRTGHHACGRNGKHSFEGDTCTYGLVIDVSNIRGAEKTSGDTIRLGAGLTLGQVVWEVEKGMGFVVPMGHCATVGVTGLMLVGGQGILSRHLGMLSDYVSAVELVDAKGKLVRATGGNKYADLLWLARGGGSGIQHYPGIITALELSGLPKFEVEKPSDVTYLTFRVNFEPTIEAAVEMMMEWQKFYTDPNHVADPLFRRLTIEPWMMYESIPERSTDPVTNKTTAVPTHYETKKSVFLNVYFYGNRTLQQAFTDRYKNKILNFAGGTGKLWREHRLPFMVGLHRDLAGVKHNDLLATGEDGYDLGTVWKGFSAVSNSPVGKEVFHKIARGVFEVQPFPSRRYIELKPLRGAIQDQVQRSDTAFWHRDALWWFLASSTYNEEFSEKEVDEAVEAHRQHHETVIEAMGSSFGGHYAGYVDHGRIESPGRDLPLYYGNHSTRIMDIKMRLDPENLFHLYVPNTRHNAPPFTFLEESDPYNTS